MMIYTWMGRAATFLILSLVFAVSYGVARPRPEAQVLRALELVRTDAANRVCADGGECSLAEADHTLFVFFSLRDCPIGLYDTVILDSLYRSLPRGKLNVVGVAYDMTRHEALALARVSEISYPLYLGTDHLERYLRNPRPSAGNKPVKVLVTRSGEVVARSTSRTTVEWLRQDAQHIRTRVGT